MNIHFGNIFFRFLLPLSPCAIIKGIATRTVPPLAQQVKYLQE